MATRAIRGATTVSADSKELIVEAVVELLGEVFKANALTEADLVSILFTSTKDLTSEFPATAARTFGLTDTPLICAQELDIAGSLPRTIRLMMHVETARSKAQIAHIYLREAVSLRKDIAK
ncbi:MAG: hypothetical protein RL129_215 [Actinomycetota bacterium]|jgi:chorismate mutase